MKNPRKRPSGSSILWTLVVAAALLTAPLSAQAFWPPWDVNAPWPRTSERPVTPLPNPDLSVRAGQRVQEGSADGPVRFAVFGDQRALADGEWQAMVGEIARLDQATPIDAVIDTGDIVTDGRYTDQFARLQEILRPLAHRPYLVAIGNHELCNNKEPEARTNSAVALSSIDSSISRERLYYRKDFGKVSLLFLDTNDFVYGDDGERNACPLNADPATREGKQVIWLRGELDQLAADTSRVVICVMHHPIVQSSKKHHDAACSLWNFQDDGVALTDILADGGVDLVLTGHTHTYEHFRMVRADGREMHLVNLSGRPRDAFLWFGGESRRARFIRGRERDWFEELGWLGLDRWTIVQEDAMIGHETDEFGVVTVLPDGGVLLEMHYLEDASSLKFRVSPPVKLK